MRSTVIGRAAAAALAAALVALVIAGGAASSTTPQLVAVGTPPHIFGPSVQALKHKGGPAAAPCPLDAGGGLFIACYGPRELGQAYDFPRNLDGRGQTIVIVDAYGSPDIQQDLANFDAFFQLPDPPSFRIVNAPGTGAAGSGALSDWQSETTLDVEYAHAMAPGANIVLAIAATDDNNDINAALATVLPRYPGAIVSQSFGEDENAPDAQESNLVEHRIYIGATALGDTLLASAGDFGATDGDDPPIPVASYPASDPLVLAVGGTEGSPYEQPVRGGTLLGAGLLDHNHYGAEQVWNEADCCDVPVATGGAPSGIFARPPWQNGFTADSGRITPDVSYNAAILGGVVIVTSCYTPDVPDGCDPTDPFFSLIGGTSAGSPQWAAIVAISNEQRGMRGEPGLGLVAPALYDLAKNRPDYMQDFHDITTGNNVLGSGNDPSADPSQGFFAGRGFDDATGLGTPDVARLVSDLVGARPVKNPPVPNPGPPPRRPRPDRWHQQHPHTAEPGGA